MIFWRTLWSFLSLCPQVIWDSPVSLLVHIWAVKSVRHQREGSPRVYGVCRGNHVRDVQRYLTGGSAQHADRHDEQLLPTHCCEWKHECAERINEWGEACLVSVVQWTLLISVPIPWEVCLFRVSVLSVLIRMRPSLHVKLQNTIKMATSFLHNLKDQW